MESSAVNNWNDELYIYCVEFTADDVNKASTADDGGQPVMQGDSTSVIKKLLIESMLKSVQEMLKQQQQKDNDQQPGQYHLH